MRIAFASASFKREDFKSLKSTWVENNIHLLTLPNACVLINLDSPMRIDKHELCDNPNYVTSLMEEGSPSF